MTCVNLVKLNCITRDNLEIFYAVCQDQLSRLNKVDINSLLDCQSILLCCALTEYKVSNKLTDKDHQFLERGVTEKGSLEFNVYPDEGLHSLNRELALK